MRLKCKPDKKRVESKTKRGNENEKNKYANKSNI